MKHGPDIARFASLIGDPARANILIALLGGTALTASELASEAGVTKQTASSHLAKLRVAGFILPAAQGRHRYFRLAGPEIAHVLEELMGVAARMGAARTRPGPNEPALRSARICYDHLAGAFGVELFDALSRNSWLRLQAGNLSLTRRGVRELDAFGIEVEALASAKRNLCRPCLDWSERRYHLAGSIGAALLASIFKLGWARRAPASRAIVFSAKGENTFRRTFHLGT